MIRREICDDNTDSTSCQLPRFWIDPTVSTHRGWIPLEDLERILEELNEERE